MSDKAFLELPIVTDDDIHWVSSLLKTQFDAPRQEALKSMETLDVAACPGSGKTTLLVAKLAILAKKWPYRTSGLCVLSHTNVARQEIETKLGNTSIGRALLSYPHYIGTIHGFVNKFLTLPVLRSHGYRGIQFSTEISGDKVWRLSKYGRELPGYLYRKIKDAKKREAVIRQAHYVGEELDLVLEAANIHLRLKRSSESDSFKDINEWKQRVLSDGYATDEDTFAYGNRAIKKHPYLVTILRERFPMLFIDEAQDNSEEQAAILDRIFTVGDKLVICQRFGDANQAIYHSVSDKKATEKSRFPVAPVIDLPNSNRFSQKLADLADPLGLTRYVNGLIGHGPKKSELRTDPMKCKHTIFLFNDNNASSVLNAYGEILLKNFSEDVDHKEFSATAVGQVHRPPDEESENKFPHHVKDYWDFYDPAITRPSTFVHHVMTGQEKAITNKSTYPAVEKIAEGILRLAKMGRGQKDLSLHQQHHRSILSLLKKTDKRHDYEEIVFRFAVNRETFTKEIWEEDYRKKVKEIAEAIAEVAIPDREVETFLAWPIESGGAGACPTSSLSRCNIYSYPENEPKVHIRVGSIHSVKGQTHTATLVLETFWYKNNLESLLPWLCGEKFDYGEIPKQQEKSRLKLHYVAMTRPTHLLCLAMKQSSISGEHREKLRKRGWDFIEVI